MSEKSMFDLVWARQDQWGGEWHGLGGRFGIAAQFMDKVLTETNIPPVEDTALHERMGWIIHWLKNWVKENQPEKEAEFENLADELLDIYKRPVDPSLYRQLVDWMHTAGAESWRLRSIDDTYKLSRHLRTTNFDHVQLRHLNGLFNAQAKLALAYHGLFGNGYLNLLESNPNAPLIYVNADLMAKCATDFRLAQQAVHQRQRMPYRDNETWITWESHMLYLADLMAYECLKPLISAGILPEDTAVVTYLQQSTEIRLLPYYNIMLIALPSWVQNLYARPSLAFLVIPHEIGHSLYRFGRLGADGQLVHEKLQEGLENLGIGENDWRARWLEELFADAFGCLMAGPASVLGIQEYLATGVPAHFMEPSPDHPTAAIRPLIQTEILRIIDDRGIKSYKNVPKLLDDHWQIYLTNDGSEPLRQGAVKSVRFNLNKKGDELSGESLLEKVRPVLSLILDVFEELFPGDKSPKHWATWSNDIEADDRPVAQNLEALQEQYRQFYQSADVYNIQPPTPSPTYEPSALHLKVQNIAERIADNTTAQTVPASEWRQIFDIAGWTDEGGKASHNP